MKQNADKPNLTSSSVSNGEKHIQVPEFPPTNPLLPNSAPTNAQDQQSGWLKKLGAIIKKQQ